MLVLLSSFHSIHLVHLNYLSWWNSHAPCFLSTTLNWPVFFNFLFLSSWSLNVVLFFFFLPMVSFWVTSSNFSALNTSLYLDSQIYMSSLVLQQLPLQLSHLIFNRYLTLNMFTTELLIPIPPNILPLPFSISVNGTTSHPVSHTKDLRVILYSSLFSHPHQ